MSTTSQIVFYDVGDGEFYTLVRRAQALFGKYLAVLVSGTFLDEYGQHVVLLHPCRVFLEDDKIILLSGRHRKCIEPLEWVAQVHFQAV